MFTAVPERVEWYARRYGVNAVPPAREAYHRGSARRSIGEQNLQLAEHQIPILAPSMPVLHDPLGCQVQHPAQRIVIGEAGLVLGNLPELPV